MNRSKEIWGWIPGYRKYYKVSTIGRVRSVSRCVKDPSQNPPVLRFVRGRIKKQWLRNGYPQVTINKDGKRISLGVHTLMLLTFIGSRPRGKEGLHKDDVRTNNVIENIYWGTRVDNWKDRVRNRKSRMVK